MLYIQFIKSIIYTIRPIFFRFFSIIKYLILALLEILLYMLVGRVGAWNIGDVASIVEFQYNDTGHNRGLEHIDYSANMLSRGDAYYITTTEKQNPLRYNYSYSKGGYKVLYDNNSIWGIFAFKKGTFTHTIGYPYGITGFAKIEIPTNGFLGGLANIFSSKKFKNLVVNNNGFIFFNENENDLEINSHVCGKEFPGYYFIHIIRHQPLRVFDFKNKLVYEYDSVPSLKNGPNSGGCWILPYLEQEADRVYKFTYSSNRNYGRSLFVSNAYYTTKINHTNGNFRLLLTDKNQFNEYKRSYKLGEQISEKKIPEQYQAQVETYNNSKLKITCEKTAKDINKQISLLHQCKERTKPDNVYGWGLIDEFAIHISGRVENYRDPTKLSTANVFMNTRCKQWHDGQVAIYNTYIKNLDGSDPLYSKYINIYQDIFDKVYEPIASGGSTAFDQDSYCENNPIFIDGTKPSTTIIQTVKDGWDNLYNSYFGSSSDDAITTGNIQENTPTLLKPFKSLFDNYFNFKKFTVIETVNYCKEQGGRTFANLLYFFILILISLFLIKLFK